MASSKNIKNAREIIEYYNRKFVINITGSARAFDGAFDFDIPPLNETAFSNNYSQCLCRIKDVQISQEQDTMPLQANPVFVTGVGGSAAITSITSGIVIRTSFPCRQIKHIGSNWDVAVFGANRTFDASFHTIISPETRESYFTTGQVGAAAQNVRGSKRVMNIVNNDAANAFGIDESVNFWTWKDDSSFEDSASIIGNPFGQNHTFQLRSAFNGTPIHLAAGDNIATGGEGTQVRICFELLMLENPTPNDR